MKLITASVLLALPFFLSACKRDESLAPPEGGETVSVAVKLPPDVDVLPLGVMYRSNTCPQTRTKGNGEYYQLPGFNFIKYTLKRENGSDIYSTPVPVNGGGACRWKLSNITIDVEYQKIKFQQSLDKSIGTGVIIIFDDNSPQRDDGVYKKNSGNLTIKQDYFPWVNERFLNGHSRDIWMYGGKLYYNYKTTNTHNVMYIPVSHSDIVTYSLGVKVKANGNHTQFTYPDGTVVSDGSSFPDYEKLMSFLKKE